ncbi:hypothetical protein [Dyadobacter flavalbus]|uniref:hypothetical protein n=1 Tax=Dyadobacter flavalbus TaxID=2579942 RepID=UPI00191C0185|nr:hypothetical protein [Dyadobacter flavalbus]
MLHSKVRDKNDLIVLFSERIKSLIHFMHPIVTLIDNSNIGLLWLSIDEINIPILQGICSQIAIAIGNMMANKDIPRRRAEQQLMLRFSNDITGVKSKSDLDHVISTVLHGQFQTRIAVLYPLAEDRVTLRPYLFDRQFMNNQNDRRALV